MCLFMFVSILLSLRKEKKINYLFQTLFAQENINISISSLVFLLLKTIFEI
jgi:hypothetical protein